MTQTLTRMPLRGCFRLQQGDRSGYWSRDASECVELADRKPLANAAGRHRAVRLLKRVEELLEPLLATWPLPPWSSYWLAGRSIPPSEAMPSRKLAPPVPAT